ncbi:MAG: acyl-CoA dehydratase activase [Actinomycetota bacterium]|jgi:predicted CoA-substrate-specific enzyme activase|nr:acyl-CoA dehydratase activase [Actinomycetota bacterium]
MTYYAGVDVGSTYTKAVVVGDDGEIAGRALLKTGFRLAEAASEALESAAAAASLEPGELDYVTTTGYGRFQVSSRQLNVTDLTAAAFGARFLYPQTRTVLDVGGQTMKVSRVDGTGKVVSFRLNDKCAAGTGAFLEKTARYMGFGIEEVGPLASTSRSDVSISGVCAVFAEAEVINHLSQGIAPADIMHGAIASLVSRSVQLMKRAKMEPEHTLIGGILRFETMASLLRESLGGVVNVPSTDDVQHVLALGAALAGRQRHRSVLAGRVHA